MVSEPSSVTAGSLVELLSSYGIECDERRAALMLRHLDLVIEKNRVVNLTRIESREKGAVLHILDSLLALACREVSLGPGISFVDMGTGAGFPGVPLAILTGASGTLIDSVGKKVAAVDEFIGELGLDRLQAFHCRVEDLPQKYLHVQDYVFARAVAQSNVLVEYATPLLRMGGRLVLEKGRPSEDEVAAADRAARICGMTLVSRETFELPGDEGHREILVYERTGKPRIRLPRRAGLAKHEPLGIQEP